MAASCARCSSEMPPSEQVNGHSFIVIVIVVYVPIIIGILLQDESHFLTRFLN